jgi:hypothetical protein
MDSSGIHPDDSASQVGNFRERNERYTRDLLLNPIVEPDRQTTEGSVYDPMDETGSFIEEAPREPLSREEEVATANRLRENVKEYLSINEKSAKLMKALTELRKRKKTLQSTIIGDMRSLAVENLALNRGKLIAKRSMPKVSLTRSTIPAILSRHFADDELIQKIVTVLYEDRDRTEKVELKHMVGKNE